MLIEIKNLTKYYNYQNDNRIRALNGIDLSVDSGEMVAITGTSGAGKSTLIHVLAGLLKYESGSYLFNGENVEHFSVKRICKMRNKDIGIVFQNFALIEDYSVLLNTMIPLFFAGGKKLNKKAAAKSALKSVGILDLEDKTPANISGGEKQRCAIARAMVNNPSVLLADEPTGQLDSHTAGEVMGVLKDLNRRGVTIIIVTHDNNIASWCDRIITMSDGKIISDLTYVNDQCD